MTETTKPQSSDPPTGSGGTITSTEPEPDTTAQVSDPPDGHTVPSDY